VSPRPAETLLEAALRRPRSPEDRATEILACCLASDSDARQRFCQLVKAPPLEDAELVTQRRVTPEDRIDCELRHISGHVLHVMWIEVKVGTAIEQPHQLERYARQLRRLYPGQSTLVALAPANDPILSSAREPLTLADETVVTDHKAEPLTWPDLAYALDGVGRERDPSSTAVASSSA
jgi:hypothetical protein